MTIKVEITQMPEAGALAAIHDACFPKGWEADAISAMLAVPTTMAFTVQGLGFGLLRHAGDDAEILTLATLPSARRHGVALAIVAAMQAWASGRGAHALFLEVGEGNKAAQRLYEKSGFSVISRRKEYYLLPDGTREHALIMRLGLKK